MKKAQELLKDRIGKETFKYLRTGQPYIKNGSRKLTITHLLDKFLEETKGETF